MIRIAAGLAAVRDRRGAIAAWYLGETREEDERASLVATAMCLSPGDVQ